MDSLSNMSMSNSGKPLTFPIQIVNLMVRQKVVVYKEEIFKFKTKRLNNDVFLQSHSGHILHQ